jgi:hypothetical protein
MTNKCLILLSDKSTGSSAIQRELAKYTEVNTLQWSPHAQNESLFWIKAATLFGKPQSSMLYGNIGKSASNARSGLRELLKINLGEEVNNLSDDALVFEGWHKLCQKFAPIFFEKSPHHLHSWSSLELINECVSMYPDVDFKFIGLVRNPMDTIYSHWTRWKVDPELKQFEWHHVYSNLLKFKEIQKDRLYIVRYEDLVSNGAAMAELLIFVGLQIKPDYTPVLHKGSLAKWKKDSLFGLRLDRNVIDLAENFGYSEKELDNPSYLLWPLYRICISRSYKSSMFLKAVRQKIRRLKK